jgi:UDP:flavonoid glycosyltransferase YjiC (YdhE family)
MNMFLTVFNKLDMRIIWKFDNKKIEIPLHVLTRKTLPQNSILEHKNVKLFITHGGQTSLQEGVLHKKPMIVIPTYPDQVG